MKWSIGKKLGLGFGVAVAALALMGYLAHRNTQLLAEANTSEAASFKADAQLTDMAVQLQKADIAHAYYLLTGQERYIAEIRETQAGTRKEMETLRVLVKDNPQHMNRLAALEKLIDERFADLNSAIESKKTTTPEAAIQSVSSEKSLRNKEAIHALITEFDKEEDLTTREREKEIENLVRNIEVTVLVITFAMLLFLVVFAFYLTRGITSGTQRLLASATAISKGNLKKEELPVTSTDEIGELTHAFNRMVGSIKEMTGQTRTATLNITSATAQILSSTQQQASSTTEQAAAVQQTTATLEEITQSGNQVSERAKQVAAAAEAASTSSESGIQAVQDANKTMDAIREQAEAVAENIVTLSEKTQTVGEIIASVNEIAEQSNLLALNAAIEAAAAGDHGRRFSVVAAELKNLADQSKAATVQVRTILGDIQKGINTSVMLTEETVKRVELGKKQSDIAERTIRQMADSTVSSVQAFQQIVAATNQQQIGFEQVTTALKNIRVASKQTADGTQQMEKAAANLNSLGQQLSKSVERYEL